MKGSATATSLGVTPEDCAEREAILTGFAGNLKRLRLAAGLSQTELAVRCCIEHHEVSQLECATRPPHFYLLLKIADQLEAPIGELLADVPPPRHEGTGRRLIEMVNCEPGIETETLAERLGAHRSYVSAVGKRLEVEGLLTRRGLCWWPPDRESGA